MVSSCVFSGFQRNEAESMKKPDPTREARAHALRHVEDFFAALSQQHSPSSQPTVAASFETCSNVY